MTFPRDGSPCQDRRVIDSELRAYLDEQFGLVAHQFAAVNQQFAPINQRFIAIDERFASIDQRFDGIDRRLDTMDQRLDAMDQRIEEVRQESQRHHAETLRQFHVIEERLYGRMALLAEGHGGLVQRIDGLEEKLETVAAGLRGEMHAGFRLLRREIRAKRRRH